MSELAQWRRVEAWAADAHQCKMDELREELRATEACARDHSWTLRNELAEACTEGEVIECELEGAKRGSQVALEKLQCEEQILLHEVEGVEAESVIEGFQAKSATKQCITAPIDELVTSATTRSAHRATAQPKCYSEQNEPTMLPEDVPLNAGTRSLSLLEELQGTPHGITACGDLQIQESPPASRRTFGTLRLDGLHAQGDGEGQNPVQRKSAVMQARRRRTRASLACYNYEGAVRVQGPDDNNTNCTLTSTFASSSSSSSSVKHLERLEDTNSNQTSKLLCAIHEENPASKPEPLDLPCRGIAGLRPGHQAGEGPWQASEQDAMPTPPWETASRLGRSTSSVGAGGEVHRSSRCSLAHRAPFFKGLGSKDSGGCTVHSINDGATPRHPGRCRLNFITRCLTGMVSLRTHQIQTTSNGHLLRAALSHRCRRLASLKVHSIPRTCRLLFLGVAMMF